LAQNGFQSFEFITDVILGKKNNLQVDEILYKPEVDYIPLSFSIDTIFSGEVFFAGYGFDINNDSLKWNDYENINVSNKWVMIMRGAPDGNNPHSKYGEHISLRKKSIIAKDNNAAGVIFISGKEFSLQDELVPLSYEQSQQEIGIPIINVKRNVANQILRKKNITLETLEKKINDKLEMFDGFYIKNNISVEIDLNFRSDTTQNVIGMLPSKQEFYNDEYIVIGAHYDHLGFGGDGSGSRRPYLNEIHNGADDNASGVSILLELSKLLSSYSYNYRNIVFIAFGAEEIGLLGSKYFVSSQLIPNQKIQLMLNMDMVGRLNEDKIINVSGTKTALQLEGKLENILNKKNMSYTFSPEGYGPSDHSSFYVKDVPVLFFFTGAHNDYHTPNDDYKKLNYLGMELITDLIHKIILDFDNTEKLEFQKSGAKESKRPSKFKVTLGIMPDYVFKDIKGLRIDAVIPDRPASKAGLLSGDIIVKINDRPVGDIYEYMHRLSELSTGQTVPILIIRDKSEYEFSVTF